MNTNIKTILLTSQNKLDWKRFLNKELDRTQAINIEIEINDLRLNVKDLLYCKLLCNKLGKVLSKIKSTRVETIVSAESISLVSELSLTNKGKKLSCLETCNFNQKDVTFHQATIRAGESIHSEGDLLVLGDVNPGAIVSANGDIMIWGKLLGIAHAGKSGNLNSKISALKLKPVQLRIANKVAIGPKESPEEALAEQASVLSGLIVINPLSI